MRWQHSSHLSLSTVLLFVTNAHRRAIGNPHQAKRTYPYFRLQEMGQYHFFKSLASSHFPPSMLRFIYPFPSFPTVYLCLVTNEPPPRPLVCVLHCLSKSPHDTSSARRKTKNGELTIQNTKRTTINKTFLVICHTHTVPSMTLNRPPLTQTAVSVTLTCSAPIRIAVLSSSSSTLSVTQTMSSSRSVLETPSET